MNSSSAVLKAIIEALLANDRNLRLIYLLAKILGKPKDPKQ